ncbi:winged helix-turn-helix domain-containing protein [Rubricoccus marinus]|uniref:OmpR/PhoB-type domain-containing protein n=1 Tax=Rubricoccus marinus TaxID=716817 RepID=A0A259U3T1_9BACT|nr:transcriptional regulator [Rubricoccus marinus]OZC04488.1 hypothetical protein BSZ36_16805 [Rubricoccus marinus]
MPDLALPSDAFRLGDLVVVPSLNRLVREGEAQDVEPRVMRVLAVLAETPGEVVTRAALFEAVWGETVVGDEALTRAVSELRKALGAEGSGAVETIRGTGYRLAAPVRPLAPEASAVEQPAGEESAGASLLRRPARGGALVALALGLAGAALLVALWAAWPRPDATGDLPLRSGAPASQARQDSAGATRLDSTSPYFRPGMSELGVYYDSSTGHYFEFVDE